MALPISTNHSKAVVSAFQKGNNGFRFITIISKDSQGFRFELNGKIFNAAGGLSLQVGKRYPVELKFNQGEVQLQILPSLTRSGDEKNSIHKIPKEVTILKGEETFFKKASAEFLCNQLEGQEEFLKNFYNDLFHCRFQDKDFQERLEIFNGCGQPPQFRTIVPFQWEGIEGYLDFYILRGQLKSYRFRILSHTIDALLHIDLDSKQIQVDSFGQRDLTAQQLSQLTSLSQYLIKKGLGNPSPLSYSEGFSSQQVDQWM